MKRVSIAIAALAALATAAGCAANPAPAPVATHPHSILASSSPAAGQVVKSAPDSLKLHFDPPARLDEVTVTGPDGKMPMMIDSVGEVADYDLPLSGMSAGSYTVEWKATSSGSDHNGSFSFKVGR